MRGDELSQVRTADLLFSFDTELDIGRQGAGLHHHLQRFYMHVELSFVIGRAPRIDLTVFDHRVEGTAVPEFQGIGRLYIIVTIDQYGRFGGVGDLLAIYDGMPL